MNIILDNADPYGNQFRVTDSNAGNAVILNQYIAAHEQITIDCRASDSGFGNIITYQDSNSGVARSFLREGDTVRL
jgi:hypothetical protein